MGQSQSQSQSSTTTTTTTTTTTQSPTPPTTTDFTSHLPDDILSLIFHHLPTADRNRCSLVSTRWLHIESQTRHRLALNATNDLHTVIPHLFTRFNSITNLTLRSHRRSTTISDEALLLISLHCPNLTRLKLRGCREVTNIGIANLTANCTQLTKFTTTSCMFGVKGVYALAQSSSSLQELSVKRLRDPPSDAVAAAADDDAVTAFSSASGSAWSTLLKSVCLKELYNGQLFKPLITGARTLTTLKLLRCLGDWDHVLTLAASSDNFLVEVHLDRVQVSDIGLSALSNCTKLEVLHIVKTPECSDLGVVTVAENCRYLRKLHIDGWRTNRIGNEGLLAIAKHSVNLQELVLIGVNPGLISVEAIATNCRKLERLALCGSETIGDSEISCIAEKCVALKKLCIKGCSVSDHGIEAFAWGCPNLVKIKVKKCKNVSFEVGDWLRAQRGSLVVSLDPCEVESEAVDGGDGDVVQEDVVEFPPIVTVTQPNPGSVRSNSTGSRRGSIFKTRFGFLGGRSFVACAFGRWSSGNSS